MNLVNEHCLSNSGDRSNRKSRVKNKRVSEKIFQAKRAVNKFEIVAFPNLVCCTQGGFN